MNLIEAILFPILFAYAQRFLALWNAGTMGFIGLAKETAWGTPLAATDYLELMSENIVTTIDRFPVRNAYGGFYEPDDYAGVNRVAGELVMFGQATMIGHLLKAALNTLSGSTVLSGFLYQTRFISTKSEFADGVPSQPYTLEVARDSNVNSSHQYTGMVCDRLTLNLAPNQDLRCTARWLGKTSTLIGRSAPTFPSSPTKPFAFDTASVQLAGAATARLEMFQVDINNNLEGIPALNNSTLVSRIRRRGAQEIRVRGTLDFVDNTEYLDFINQTERALNVNLFIAQSFNLYIEVPRFVYTTYPVAIAGRGRIAVNFDGIARYLTSSGTAFSALLTNTKSNY